MPDADDPIPGSCMDCGACCFGDGDRYLSVSGHDHGRLGAGQDGLTHFIGNRCYMRLVDRHCAALSVRDLAPRFHCSVYASRPGACRHLERGSAECHAQHAQKFGRARRALPTAVVP